MKKKIPPLRAKKLPKRLREQLEPKYIRSNTKKGRIPGTHKHAIEKMGLREGDVPPHYYKYKLTTFKEKVRQWIEEHPGLVRKKGAKKGK